MGVEVAANVDVFQFYAGGHCAYKVTHLATNHLHLPHIISITKPVLKVVISKEPICNPQILLWFFKLS